MKINIKSYLINIIFILLIFTLFGCEDAVKPYIEEPEYILNCILKSTDSVQTAMLYKPVETPRDNNKAEVEKPVKIYVKNGNTKYLFEKVSGEKYLYKSIFNIEANKLYEIEANIGKDKILKSFTQVHKNLKYSYSINLLMTQRLPASMIRNPYSSPDTSEIYLSNFNLRYNVEPRLKLVISETINGSEVFDTLDVPFEFLRYGYDQIYRFHPTIKLKSEDIRAVVNQIRINSYDHSKISLYHFYLELIITDPDVYDYFHSTTLFDEGYSRSLSYSDFTNIQDGFGIFGNVIRVIKKFDVNKYIFQFYGFKELNATI